MFCVQFLINLNKFRYNKWSGGFKKIKKLVAFLIFPLLHEKSICILTCFFSSSVKVNILSKTSVTNCFLSLWYLFPLFIIDSTVLHTKLDNSGDKRRSNKSGISSINLAAIPRRIPWYFTWALILLRVVLMTLVYT